MSSYIPFSIPGSLAPWVNTDHAIGVLGIAGTVVRTYIMVTDAPSGDDLDVDLRDAAAGGGSGITVTVTDGTTYKTNEDDELAVAADETLYIRITEDAGALNLTGWFEFEPTGAGDVYAFFTTLARVKTDADISVATYDAQLSRIIQAKTAKMQNWMQRDIVNTQYTDEVHSGNGWQDQMVLKHRPVTSTVSMVVEEDDVEVSSSLYTCDDAASILYLTDSCWTSGRRNYKVTYSAGYAAVPEDLVHACTEEVIHAFRQSGPGGGRLGLHSNADGSGGSTSYVEGGFLRSTIEAMSPYRRLLA